MTIHYQSLLCYKITRKSERRIQEYSTIKRLIDEFEKMGSVHDALSKGRKKKVTLKKRNKIIQLIEATSTISNCCLVLQVQILYTSTYCAMQETKLLYHIHIFQELKPPDASKRRHICHWLYNLVHNRHSILNYVFSSKEAWFNECG